MLRPILRLFWRYAAAFSYSTRQHILDSETGGRIRSEGQVHYEVVVYQAFMQEVSSSLITNVKTGLEKRCLLKVAMRWPFLTHTNMGFACLPQGMWLYYLGFHHQFQICDWDRLSYGEVAEKGSQLRLL